MQAEKKNIFKFLRQTNQLVIPVYQRNYDWKKENCKQLFDDIERIAKTDNETHFVGTICTKMGHSYSSVIIDGQQRITSLMLLLKVISHNTNNDRLRQQIENNFLLNNTYDVDCKVRLKPIKKDYDVFVKLMSSISFHEGQYTTKDKNSNVYKNYILFSSLVEKSDVSLEQIKKAIERLEIVELEVENENPQVIFEGLNSTGLDLTNTDLLRNYLLMALDYQTQEVFYNNYWLQIEELLGSENMEQFMLYYLIMKRRNDKSIINDKQTKITSKSLYDIFKKTYPNINSLKSESVVKERLSDIKKYAEHYFKITNPDICKKDKVNEKLYELFVNLGSIDSAIFVMPLYEEYSNNNLSEKDFVDILDVLVSFVFRSKICKKTGMNTQVAASLITRYENIKQKNISEKDKMYEILVMNKGSYAFPKDNEFKYELINKDLYNSLKSVGCRYLLGKIEKYNSKETVDVSDATIEHIIPQTLSKEWTEYLNKHFDLQNYDLCVHTLGNLTLTKYNSEASNDIFKEKQKIYKESNFSFTRNLGGHTDFTSKNVYKRAEKLANYALKIWELPEEYNKTVTLKSDIVYNLDTDFRNFTGTKPNVVHFLDNQFLVQYWSEFWTMFHQSLYDIYGDKYIDIAQVKWISNHTPLISIKQDAKYTYEIDKDKYYLNKGFSTETILFYINEIITEIDRVKNTSYRNDIWFTLKDKDDESNILELRENYWISFVEYLKKDNDFFNVFDLPKITQEYYMDFKFDFKGCHIFVSQQRLRKELEIGLYIRNNDDLYNKLHHNKINIENIIGMSLEWQSDAKTVCRVICSIENDFSDIKNNENQFKNIKEKIYLLKEIIEKYN